MITKQEPFKEDFNDGNFTGWNTSTAGASTAHLYTGHLWDEDIHQYYSPLPSLNAPNVNGHFDPLMHLRRPGFDDFVDFVLDRWYEGSWIFSPHRPPNSKFPGEVKAGFDVGGTLLIGVGGLLVIGGAAPLLGVGFAGGGAVLVIVSVYDTVQGLRGDAENLSPPFRERHLQPVACLR